MFFYRIAKLRLFYFLLRNKNTGNVALKLKTSIKEAMWTSELVSYVIVAMCLFPVSIVGFWGYGNKHYIFFGGLTFLVAVAFPFLGKWAMLAGGLTLNFPCFIWNSVKDRKYSRM
ncbi:hypothetical protein ACFE04_025997 [Oxalis oulophora]